MAEGVLHHIKGVRGFMPGEYIDTPGWIKLNTNENPFAPSPRVIEALQRFLETRSESLRRYPEPWSPQIAQAIAQLHALNPEQVVVANGTQELLTGIFRMNVPVGEAIGFHGPGYGLYEALTLLQSARAVPVLLCEKSPELDVDAIVATQVPLFIMSCPHSPTGVRFELSQICNLIKRFKGYVVIDEAYALFAESTALSLLADYPNLIITRTFSKSHQMAGMRVAYALGEAKVMEQLRKFVDPYAVDRLALVAALAALEDNLLIQSQIAELIETRERVYTEFVGRGWRTFRSEGNFLFTQPKNASGATGREVAQALYEFLKANKILIRHLDDAWACSYLRFGIGCKSSMDKVIAVTEKWLSTSAH